MSERRVRFGPFTLRARIGVGGMGEVFRATIGGLDVALKLIRPEFAGDRHFREMFIREAELSALMRHPNIVRVYDYGEVDSALFLSMELVDGVSLSQCLARAPLREGVALHVVRAVLDALDYAHHLTGPDGRELGLIHRDVSAANVLLSNRGEIKLTDFGIAKVAGQNLTATRQVKGKLAYMAPEQVLRAPVDRRADVFAVGVLLHKLLLGCEPFRAVDEWLQEGAPLAPTGRFAEVLRRALARDPEERFSSAAELAAALHAIAPPGIEAAEQLAARVRGSPAPEARLAAFDELLIAEFSGAQVRSRIQDESTTHRVAEAAPARVDGSETNRVAEAAPALADGSETNRVAEAAPAPADGSETNRVAEAAPAPAERSTTVRVDGSARELAQESTVRLVAPSRAEPPTAIVDGWSRVATTTRRSRAAPRPAARWIVASGVAIALLGGLALLRARREASDAPPAPAPPLTAIARSDETVRSAEDSAAAVPHIQPAALEQPAVGPSPGAVGEQRADPELAPVPPALAPVPPALHDASARPAPAHARARAASAPPGFLSLDTEPWSTVYLGGRRIGTTPFVRAPLPPGRHRLLLDLRNSGQRRHLSITVTSGAETPLAVRLP